MIKDKYLLNDENNIHQYTVVVKEKNGKVIYTLMTSDGHEWSEGFNGVKLVRAIDTGNGFKIIPYEFDINDMGGDYSATGYLHLLLDAIHKIDGSLQDKHTLYKAIEL